MKKKLAVIGTSLVAIIGVGLITSLSVASAHVKPAAAPYCEYGEYNQYGECCTYGEYSQYGECCTGGYSEYCEPATGTPQGTSSQSQTISGSATPAGVSVRTTYPKDSTLVDINLPAGVEAKQFYFYTVLGVSFGINHNYKLLKKDLLVYSGNKPVAYHITKLSWPHGRVHLVTPKALASATFKVSKNVFEFTAHERKLIEKLKIKTTMVTVEITSTTGKVYTVHFKALFGAPVVVAIH